MKKTETSDIDVKVKESEIVTSLDDINIRKCWLLLGILESDHIRDGYSGFSETVPKDITISDQDYRKEVESKLMEIVRKF